MDAFLKPKRLQHENFQNENVWRWQKPHAAPELTARATVRIDAMPVAKARESVWHVTHAATGYDGANLAIYVGKQQPHDGGVAARPFQFPTWKSSMPDGVCVLQLGTFSGYLAL